MKKIIIVVFLILCCIIAMLVLRIRESDDAPQETYGLGVAIYDVQNAENPSDTDAAITEAFDLFITDQYPDDTWLQFTNEGTPVALSEGMDALSTSIDRNLVSLLDDYQWQMYKCDALKGGKAGIVLSLYFKYNPEYPGNLYVDQLRYMDTWEETLFADMQPVLFPYKIYGTASMQSSSFENNAQYTFSTLREAKVRLSDGAEGYIGYIFVGDELLIGNDQQCLLQAQEMLFDTGA